ncbi:conserved hypothetical protein [Aspergillus terreus NIH2624]|uniref:Methyltransferase domain-containing protein n=1 Tax=Aspergillus terreus (strain NIH 2624 / FGSC A1156) TaxID=341663 RepID=Q0CXZ4_ASPTN|nr:uncharacterized protein ATEG_01440 [Aspergillus terreus NIH2624]EAU38197.1 conserved hypothetical protein [Aspergillus terreus NIH2624]
MPWNILLWRASDDRFVADKILMPPWSTQHRICPPSHVKSHNREVIQGNSATTDSLSEKELDEKYLSIINIRGRGYQKFSIDHRISFEPVDEEEAERLESQHQVLNRVFDNRLIFPPVPRLRRILDCGYGAGSWAVDVAERHPDCEVIGVDISPHMNPDDTPENLWLQVDDLNHPFTFPSNHFDLVHSRLVATGINRARWPGYIRDIQRSGI